MGSLSEQPPRQQTIDGYYEHLKYLLGVEHKDIPLEQSIKIMELAIKLQDGDVKDEQLMGLGEILNELVSALQEISRVIEEK